MSRLVALNMHTARLTVAPRIFWTSMNPMTSCQSSELGDPVPHWEISSATLWLNGNLTNLQANCLKIKSGNYRENNTKKTYNNKLSKKEMKRKNINNRGNKRILIKSRGSSLSCCRSIWGNSHRLQKRWKGNLINKRRIDLKSLINHSRKLVVWWNLCTNNNLVIYNQIPHKLLSSSNYHHLLYYHQFSRIITTTFKIPSYRIYQKPDLQIMHTMKCAEYKKNYRIK